MAKKGGKKSNSKSHNIEDENSNDQKVIVVGMNGEGSIQQLPKGYKPNKMNYSPKKNRHNQYCNISYEAYKKMQELTAATGKLEMSMQQRMIRPDIFEVKQDYKPRKEENSKIRSMIEQLKKFCDSTKNEISKLKSDIKGIENASICDLDKIKDSLVYLKNDYGSQVEKEVKKMNDIHERKLKIEVEVQIVIKRLIHPQAKEDYDDVTENKIVSKTIEILLTKDTCGTFENTIRNYVLKMKVRNKIGLKLSKWVGYTGIPNELVAPQIHNHDAVQKIKSTYAPGVPSDTSFLQMSNKRKQVKQKQSEETGKLQEKKQQKQIEFLRSKLKMIFKRKTQLREAIEKQNWVYAVDQGGQ